MTIATPLVIAVLGTGPVGRALAGRLGSLGHDVRLGTRDPAATGRREEHRTWHEEHAEVTVATFAEAATDADVVVNACGGEVTLEVLDQVGAELLDGVVLVDVSNPLDFSAGFPPRLSVCNDDSLGEQVQHAFPGARVVKTLNTMNSAVMVDPARLGASASVFVSGDDPDAKAVVARLLREMGHDDVIDLGGITSARGVEMFLPLWLRLAGALGSSEVGIAVVRP
jgi:8-hydroxy-5-deazaflavin:NADPH oxidoreductase